jgi:serine/threonine protein kinase
MFFFQRVMMILWEVANGLLSAHSKNIMHRDLKIENVFVKKDGHCKLGDFNLSKKLDDSLEMTKSLVGTWLIIFFFFFFS